MNTTLSADAIPRVGAAARAAMTPIRLDRQRAWVNPATGVVQVAQLWTGLPDGQTLFLHTTATPGQEQLQTSDNLGAHRWMSKAFNQHKPGPGFEPITDSAAQTRLVDMGHDRGQCTSCGRPLPAAGRWCPDCGSYRTVSLAVAREARFLAREARLKADIAIDPRRRELFLDRTIWNTEQARKFLDITANRVTGLRGNTMTDEDGKPFEVDYEDDGTLPPKAKRFPDLDVILRVMFGLVHPGVEAGRVREWAEQSDRVVFNPDTGDFEPNTAPRRHGRSRSSAA